MLNGAKRTQKVYISLNNYLTSFKILVKCTQRYNTQRSAAISHFYRAPHSTSSLRSTLPLLICNKITPQTLSEDPKDGGAPRLGAGPLFVLGYRVHRSASLSRRVLPTWPVSKQLDVPVNFDIIILMIQQMDRERGRRQDGANGRL